MARVWTHFVTAASARHKTDGKTHWSVRGTELRLHSTTNEPSPVTK